MRRNPAAAGIVVATGQSRRSMARPTATFWPSRRHLCGWGGSAAFSGQALPRDFPAAVLVTIHLPRHSRSLLDEVSKSRRTAISCDLIRYRCHVGHTSATELMSVALDDNLRRALASALRTLEEREALVRKLHRQAIAGGNRLPAENWAQKAQEFERETKVMRESIRRVDQLAAISARGGGSRSGVGARAERSGGNCHESRKADTSETRTLLGSTPLHPRGVS